MYSVAALTLLLASLGAWEIEAVVVPQRAKLRQCAVDAGETGRIKIAFVIAPSGKVASAKVEEVNGFGAKVVKCMVARTREMVFSASSDDTNVSFPVIVR